MKSTKKRLSIAFAHPLALAVLAAVFSACNNTPVIEIKDDNKVDLKENLINANKVIASSEQTQIDGYLSRRNWPTTQLPCGARMWEYEQAKGRQVDFEDTIVIRYKLSTLTDNTIYGETEERVVVGRHQVVTGVDEALLRMRKGSRAHIIIPSEAGYGVVGDGDRVPSRTVLVYDLAIVEK